MDPRSQDTWAYGTRYAPKRRGRRYSLVATFTAFALVLSSAAAFGAVSTDQPDYAPGSVVTISGDNSNGGGYLAGETVAVEVSGPNGYTASCEGVADDNGAWSCQVTLWDSELAEGEYSYTATGSTSGISETGSFTDHGPSPVTSSSFSITADASHVVTVSVVLGGGSTTVSLTPATAKIANQTLATAFDVSLTGPGGNGNGMWSGSFQGACGTTYKINNVVVTWSTTHTHLSTETPGGTVSVTTGACVHNVNFATSGLPTGTSVSVDWNATNPAGGAASGPTVFDSQNTSANVATKPGTAFTYSFPATLTPTGQTCTRSGTSPASGFTTGAAGGSTTVTATYSCVATNSAPVVTGPGNQTAFEGTAKSFSLGSFTDAGPSPWDVTVVWGDSTTDTTFSLTSAGSLGSQSHTYADNGTYTVTVKVKDNGSPRLEGSATFDVVVSNLDPTVAITGDTPVDEGQSKTYSFDTTDLGTLDTFTAGTPSCGASGAYVAASLVFSTSTGDGSFSCSFPDDHPTNTASDTTSVSIVITDDDTGAGTGTKVVTVNNLDPTVAITGDTPVDEGQSKTYSFDTTDLGTLDTFTAGTPSCGASGAYVAASLVFSTSTGDGSFSCSFPDDSPTNTASDSTSVSITITDDDTGAGTGTKVVTVNNVNPVASGGSVIINPWTGVGTASFSYSDVGVNDTHTATFTGWTGGSTPSASAGTASSTKTFAPGCYTLTVTGYVTDDDTGVSNTVMLADAQQFPVYSVAFLPPIKDGERNIVKWGNVVPVKVAVTNPCTGAPVTANLYVSYYQGMGDPVDTTPVVIGESVATPDGTSGQMRQADGFYIFNFSTKPLTVNSDYTIRIWKDAIGGLGGSASATFLADAVLRPKK